MFKKISAIALSVCILAMTAYIVPVSAISEVSIDNFENAADNIINGTTNGDDYYYAGSNGLLIKPGNRMYSNHLSIAENEGYDESDALYVSCDKTLNNSNLYRGAILATKAVTLTEENAAVLRYKINIKDYPVSAISTNIIRLSGIRNVNTQNNQPVTSTTPFEVGNSGGTPYFINTKNTNQKFEFDKNKWYTVVTQISKATAEKDWEAYILDENNNIVMSLSDKLNSSVITENEPIYFFPCFVQSGYYGKNETPVRFLMDDLSLTEYKVNQNPSFDFTNSNLENNEIDVPINKIFDIAFDQEITSPEDGDVILYRAEDVSKTPIDISISNITFNSFTVKTETNLDGNTDYILDFSGITNSKNLGLDSKTISFKTIDTAKEPVSLLGAALSDGSALEDGDTEIALEESFVLNFDKKIAAPAQNEDIKIYKYADKTTVKVSLDVSGGSVTVKPLEKLKLNTKYILDFSGVLSDTFGGVTGTNKLSFTTMARREMLFYEDDIESASVGAITSYQSDIFSVTNSKLTVVENGGYNGSKGIRINKAAGASGDGIKTKKYELDASEKLYFEFKLNISKVTGDSGRIYVNDAGYKNMMLAVSTDGYGYPFMGKTSTTQYPYYLRLNTWHTVVCEISAATQKVYVFDESGKWLFDGAFSISDIGDEVSLYPVFCIAAGEMDAVIDDVKVYRLSDHMLDLENTSSDILAGDINAITDGEITLAFNQPLDVSTKELSDGFELLEGNEKIGASLKRIGAGAVCITPEKELSDGTKYTIKLPNIAAISGNSTEKADEIHFTTKDVYCVKATQTSLDISNGTVEQGTVTLTLQNSGEELKGAVIVAAMYEEGRPQRLIKMKVFDNINVPEGTNTQTLTFTEQYLNVSSVQFFLYDSIDNLKTLMRGYDVSR